VSRILERFRRAQAEREAREQVDLILREVGELDDDAPLELRGTAAGDSRRLRGLPAIGRGVSGTMPGTSPHGALLAKESRRQ
jgi:hypothetical protein